MPKLHALQPMPPEHNLHAVLHLVPKHGPHVQQLSMAGTSSGLTSFEHTLQSHTSCSHVMHAHLGKPPGLHEHPAHLNEQSGLYKHGPHLQHGLLSLGLQHS